MKSKEPAKKVIKIEPHGRKCWPSTSIYVRGTSVSFTYKTINESVADLLVIPYKDMTFGIYPGTIVNSFEKVDYRKVLTEKGPKADKVGSVCIQKCVGLDNFKALGFMKIGIQEEVEKCFIDFF